MYDVAIVGAGCTGSFLARLLSDQGFDVLVVEKDREVGDSVNCSGIIGAVAFSSLGLPRQTIQGTVRNLRVFGPSGNSVIYPSPKPIAYIVDRVQFDRALAEQAVRSGAIYSLESRVKDLWVAPDGVCLRARVAGEMQVIRAKACVVSTGFGMKFAPLQGLGTISEYIQGAQLEAVVDGIEDPEIYLGQRVAPGFFAWVVPIGDGRCKVGLLVRERASDHLKRFISSALFANRLRSWDGRLKASYLPLGPIPKSFSERVLVLGEAAGQVKITTSGGIYYGLLCAKVAAEELAKAFRKGDLSEAALANYEARWKAMLEPEYRMGKAFLGAVSKISDSQIDALIDLARVDGVIPLVRKFFRFDWHSSVLSAIMATYVKVFADK